MESITSSDSMNGVICLYLALKSLQSESFKLVINIRQ